MKWNVDPFRSKSVNMNNDMGRLYIDIPLRDAKKLAKLLNEFDLIEIINTFQESIVALDELEKERNEYREKYINTLKEYMNYMLNTKDSVQSIYDAFEQANTEMEKYHNDK